MPCIVSSIFGRVHPRADTRFVAGLGLALILLVPNLSAADYFVDRQSGDDAATGTTAAQAWRSLDPIRDLKLRAGDQLLLAANQIHRGSIALANISGTADAPIRIASYGKDPAARATIDARGQPNAIHLRNARHVIVENLIICADAGGMPANAGKDSDMRCGVRVDTTAAGTYGNIVLRHLWVRDVFYAEAGTSRSAKEVHSANGTQPYGWGIRFMNSREDSQLDDLTVEHCLIENVGHTGLKFTSRSEGIQRLTIRHNRILRTGGPGMQMSGVVAGHVHDNAVDQSGCPDDSRKWGRGSGLWTWGCTAILIEHNRFTNANGPGDSAGCHIDFNCRDVVVQYNFSAHNAGGFCEILGNNDNCAYRYNISVDDGARVKGRNGAFQEGKVLWLSGFVGKDRTPTGPFNSYIYNNTIYTSDAQAAKLSFAPSAEGILLANNIFYFCGPVTSVLGDQFKAEKNRTIVGDRVVFRNNLYLVPDAWPTDIALQDTHPLQGEPDFARPGGTQLLDYLPRAREHIQDLGISITPIPGDKIGLRIGLTVTHDILGRPITGLPDLGAIELNP